MSTESLVKEVGRLAVPLKKAGGLQRLVERISKARVVMLGEASHGTHEFYEWRHNISESLISRRGFHFIALEADWPAAHAARAIGSCSLGGSCFYDISFLLSLARKCRFTVTGWRIQSLYCCVPCRRMQNACRIQIRTRQ